MTPREEIVVKLLNDLHNIIEALMPYVLVWVVYQVNKLNLVNRIKEGRQKGRRVEDVSRETNGKGTKPLNGE